MFTNWNLKACIFSLVERVILNSGRERMTLKIICLIVLCCTFPASFSLLFVSLTNTEKPSASVGGGAVRQRV